MAKRGQRGPIPVQVVDFFSGCGGMSYGFAVAETSNVRFEIKGAVDTDPHANATYQRALGVMPLREDVKTLVAPDRLVTAVKDWELSTEDPLLLIGCAPCQGFSSHRKKDSRTDTRNSLLVSFAKAVVQLRPEIVVMENVPEIFQRSHWHHFAKWRKLLTENGYRVRAQIHNLATFGVPQERFRALVIATRDWSRFAMPAPSHGLEDFVTVRDAISHLPPLEAGGIDAEDSMHITSRHRKETVDLLRLIPSDGGSRRSLPEGVGPACLQKVDGFRDVYGRLSWDKPAVAITARCRTPSCGRYVHPEQHRGLSVREAALLQGFPPDFYFEGPFDDKFKQIGNAVSPVFAKKIAEHIDAIWLPEREQEGEVNFEEDVVEPLAKSFSSSIAGLKRRIREEQSTDLEPVAV